MIVVTGGSGNIGRRVLARLSKSHEVINVDRVEPPVEGPVQTVIADLTDPQSLDGIGGEISAIVHLAAIPNPYVAPVAEVMRVNMVGTFNVLQFAVARGIPRVIFGSSESASGWGIHGRWYRPDYLPIDEAHRSLPSEAYSYTKAFGDLMCHGFSREHDLQTVCLRYTFVTFDALYAQFIAGATGPEPREALGSTYAWIDVEDVASAIERAIAVPMEPGQTETYYLTAREHYGTLDTVEMARRNWGDSLPIDHTYYADHPRGSMFDIRKAERELAWQPEWTVERVVAEHARVG